MGTDFLFNFGLQNNKKYYVFLLKYNVITITPRPKTLSDVIQVSIRAKQPLTICKNQWKIVFKWVFFHLTMKQTKIKKYLIQQILIFIIFTI